MRFKISRSAEQDIVEIGEFIGRGNPVRALSFTRALRAKIAQAALAPEAYRERPELKPGVRAARLGRYLIFFHIDAGIVEVLRVWHGARDTTKLFQD